MSRLYYTEDGRVLPTLCEELTRFRHARKTLLLPPTEEAASLYLLARSYPDTYTGTATGVGAATANRA